MSGKRSDFIIVDELFQRIHNCDHSAAIIHQRLLTQTLKSNNKGWWKQTYEDLSNALNMVVGAKTVQRVTARLLREGWIYRYYRSRYDRTYLYRVNLPKLASAVRVLQRQASISCTNNQCLYKFDAKIQKGIETLFLDKSKTSCPDIYNKTSCHHAPAMMSSLTRHDVLTNPPSCPDIYNEYIYEDKNEDKSDIINSAKAKKTEEGAEAPPSEISPARVGEAPLQGSAATSPLIEKTSEIFKAQAGGVLKFFQCMRDPDWESAATSILNNFQPKTILEEYPNILNRTKEKKIGYNRKYCWKAFSDYEEESKKSKPAQKQKATTPAPIHRPLGKVIPQLHKRYTRDDIPTLSDEDLQHKSNPKDEAAYWTYRCSCGATLDHLDAICKNCEAELDWTNFNYNVFLKTKIS